MSIIGEAANGEELVELQKHLQAGCLRDEEHYLQALKEACRLLPSNSLND